MRHCFPILALLMVMLPTFLAGCFPSVISTEHEYVLIQPQDGKLVSVDDQDPLYARFDDQVLSDAFLRNLLAIYENTTEAFLATNKISSLTQALSNWPIIILGSGSNGAQLKALALHGDDEVRIALALGLRNDSDDLPAVREAMAAAMAPVLMRLVGLKLPEALGDASEAQPDITTSRELALAQGFGLALEALHLDAHPEKPASLQTQAVASPEARERLERWQRIEQNGYQVRFAEGKPTKFLRPPDEMWRTPGVVATFFHRWLQSNGPFYPQRHMLWMTNYDANQSPYAKVLLAMNRMPDKRRTSIQSFLASYAETFPAEREALRQLVVEVFGALPPQE